jgi:F0F1-type ATP synthase assembly protein I
MSGDPEVPLSEPGQAGNPRQNVPAATPPVLPSEEERRDRTTLMRFAGIGLQFAVTILVCLWLGTWLDRKFGTAPVFLYSGVFLGASAAFYSMYRQLMANLERDEAARRARKGAGIASSPDAPPSSQSSRKPGGAP